MQFRLKNAPLEFQYRMDEVYRPITKFCLIYIDVVLIYNKDEEQDAKYSIVQRFDV